MKTTKINNFKGYFKTLAECHLANWGVIYLDEEFSQPLEVEDVIYMLEED